MVFLIYKKYSQRDIARLFRQIQGITVGRKMGIIHLLTDDVVNKIAAGEVIDRPSSIVKELVENALDAGATEISVELEEGGTRRITVRDNGSGMARDDAMLALRRHATSKISRAEELFTIHTKGFRGEALASISAVSHLQLRTRHRTESNGTQINCRGGEADQVNDWTGDIGTELTVTGLFYNIPARSAFLKSAASEYASCLEVVQGLALISAGVGFRLTHNGKERLRIERTAPTENGLLGEADFRLRSRSVFEPDVVDQLLYVHKSADLVNIEMLTAPPGLTRGSQKFLLTYVNGRIVRDRGLKSAVIRGYHSHLLPGQFPLAILNLQIHPSLVDINVHPAKTEIRLQYASDIQSTIAIAVREALRGRDWADMQPAVDSPKEGRHQGAAISVTSDHHAPSVSTSMPQYSSYRSGLINSAPARSSYVASPRSHSHDLANFVQPPVALGSSFDFAKMDHKGEGSGRIPWEELRPIGSAFDCYLFFEGNGRMLVVDQHAFHERILYERLLQDRAQIIRSQPLLVPEVVDLAPSEVSVLIDRQEILRELGFDLSKVTETTIEVKSVPSLLIRRNIDGVLSGLAAVEANPADPVNGEMHDILSTIACHSAVRAGESLSAAELQMLQNQSESVDFYHNCPHGRRVFKWWSEAQVAGWFDR
jgi:DNA mismatch repair protein MutL